MQDLQSSAICLFKQTPTSIFFRLQKSSKRKNHTDFELDLCHPMWQRLLQWRNIGGNMAGFPQKSLCKWGERLEMDWSYVNLKILELGHGKTSSFWLVSFGLRLQCVQNRPFFLGGRKAKGKKTLTFMTFLCLLELVHLFKWIFLVPVL